MTRDFQIITENVPGNQHAAAQYINESGLADYLIQLDYSGGGSSIAIFKVPAVMAPQVRRWMNVLPEHIQNKPLFKGAPL